MGIRSRQWLFGGLIGIFFVQTWLVYSDPTGRAAPALSPAAARGQRIWRAHNCQSCHQIYGFGGFLGPDLTNAADSLTEARVDLVLTEGSGQMPAFHLEQDEREAVLRFLTEVDRTGVGVARLGPKLPVDELLRNVVGDRPLPGLAVMRKQKCLSCHLPNHGSPVRAPDLTTVLERLGRDKVAATLRNGVPGTLMPKFPFTDAERGELLALLAWLGENRDRVARAFEVTRPEGGSLLSLPWFEYE